jgi:hypothetical protein
MGARTVIVIAVLTGGMSVSGCAPSLEGSKERGGVIRYSQVRPGADGRDVAAMADKYCSQFGRSAHMSSEELGLLWSDTVTFDCVD